MGNKSKSKKSDYIVQGSILAAAGILSRLLGLLYRVPLANILGNSGNAFYGSAYSIYSILLLISANALPLAVSKLVSAQMALGHKKNAIRVFISSIILAIIVGGIIGGGTYLMADTFAEIMKSTPSSYALKVLAPTIFVVSILGAVRGYFQGLGTMIPTAVSQIVEQIVNVIVSVVAASILFDYGYKLTLEDPGNELYGPAFGAAGATMGTAVGAGVGLIFLMFVLFIYRKRMFKQLRSDKTGYLDSYSTIYRNMTMTIFPIVLGTVVYNLSDIIDQYFFNNIMESFGYSLTEYSDMLGVYTGKVKLFMNVVLSIASCLTPAMIPNLTAAVVNKDRKGTLHNVHMSLRYTMALTIPCSVGLFVLAKPIFTLLLNDSSTLAMNLMRISAPAILLYAYSTVGSGILQGINRLKAPVVNAAISLAGHIIVLYVLLKVFKLNIYGVAISSIVFALFMCILNSISLRKYLRYKQEVYKTFLIPGICSAIMGAVVFGVYWLINHLIHSNALGVVLSILLGVIVYIVSFLKLKGITEEEMYGLPKGTLIVGYAKRFHLI